MCQHNNLELMAKLRIWSTLLLLCVNTSTSPCHEDRRDCNCLTWLYFVLEVPRIEDIMSIATYMVSTTFRLILGIFTSSSRMDIEATEKTNICKYCSLASVCSTLNGGKVLMSRACLYSSSRCVVSSHSRSNSGTISSHTCFNK